MAKNCSVLTGLPIDGRGPSETCRHITRFWPAFGRKTKIYTPRASIKDSEKVCSPSLPRLLSWLPYQRSKRWLLPSTEVRCNSELRAEDILYLWPGIKQLDLIEQAKFVGAVVVKENINTHTHDMLKRY